MIDTNKLIASLSDMASFVMVVDEGGFSAASRKLGITPSAASRQVSRLEKLLAVKLLERTTRNMSLSVAGKPVYELCRTMLDTAQEAANVSSLASTEPVGLLRIAAPKAVAKQILEPMLLSFADKYPQIKLQIKVTDHIVDPIHNEVDLLVSLQQNPALGLIAKELGEVKIVLCASTGYIAEHSMPKHPDELAGHSCITLGESSHDSILEMSCGKKMAKVEVSGRYSVNHSEMRLNAIKHGLGIGVLPDFVANPEFANGNLLPVLPNWSLKHNYQGVLRLQYAQSKFIPERLRLLVAHLCDNYAASRG
ncbi:MAG: LysR family transcriptional regulator [Pseudomonadales bacterium]|nr:LysR family transcriptional regulator [Pseudomonadales bacterium]NRA14839.1 LysR family transcriptional regulator [Oceanospirillaceae bacterium]